MTGEGEGIARSMRAKDVLETLKLHGLVMKERRFGRKRSHSGDFNARARSFPYKNIIIFGDDTRLSERSLAFVILHEEGHLVQKMNSLLFRAYLIMLLLIPTGLIIWRRLIGQEPQPEDFALTALAIMFALTAPRIFREQLMRDEVLADNYAGKCMAVFAPDLTKHDVRVIFEEVLGSIKRVTFLNWFALFLGWDLHPSINERVEVVFKALVQAKRRMLLSV